MIARLWRRLGGEDAAGRAALPAGELFHPVTLGALVVLVVNDWWLKGSAAPGWLTGKLSDVAGLIAAPLVATAVLDTIAWIAARAGAPIDFTLRRWKLGAAIAIIGAAFAVVKLVPDAARAVADVLARGFGRAAIVADPTDLIALPALAVAAWIGRRELARVPLGRLEHLVRRRRRGVPIAGGLEDVAAAGGDRDAVAALGDALAAYADGGPAAPVDAALARLRRDR